MSFYTTWDILLCPPLLISRDLHGAKKNMYNISSSTHFRSNMENPWNPSWNARGVKKSEKKDAPEDHLTRLQNLKEQSRQELTSNVYIF